MEQIHNEGSNHVIVKNICKFFYTLATVFHTTEKGITCHKKLANLYIFNKYNLQGVPFEKFFLSWSKASLRFAVDLCQGERERRFYLMRDFVCILSTYVCTQWFRRKLFFFHSIFRPDFYPHSISYSFVNPQNRLLLYTHKSWVHARPLFSDGAFPP